MVRECGGGYGVLLRSLSSGPRHLLISQVPESPLVKEVATPLWVQLQPVTDQYRSIKAWCPSVNSGHL